MSAATASIWKKLAGHKPRHADGTVRATRAGWTRYSARIELPQGGILFDWSKTHLDDALVGTFEALAEAAASPSARERLFTGGIVNPTEGRAADPQRDARDRRAGRRRGSAGIARAHGHAGRCDPPGRAGRHQACDPRRDRRLGAGPGAGDRCAGAGRSLVNVHVVSNIDGSGARRGIPGLRSQAHDPRGRLQDLHHHRDHDQCRQRACVAGAGRRGRSLRPGGRAHRQPRKGGRMGR